MRLSRGHIVAQSGRRCRDEPHYRLRLEGYGYTARKTGMGSEG